MCVKNSVHRGGGFSRPTPWGEIGGLARGISRPTPRGGLREGLQAHTQGGPDPGGSRSRPGGVSQQALRQTPPPQADGYCCGRYTSYWIFRSVCQEFCSRGGGVLQAHTQGGNWGSGQGGLQAHTQGGSLGEGLQAHTQGGPGPGGSRSRPGGCIPASTEADTPPSRRLLLWAVRILLECILVNI